jgi:hypothetical protein
LGVAEELGVVSRGWGGLSSGGSGMEEDGSSGRKFGAEPLRGSAKDSSQSTLGGEAVVGPLARAAGPARGVVGPTGTAASKMSRGRQLPNHSAKRRITVEATLDSGYRFRSGHSRRETADRKRTGLRRGKSRWSAIGHSRADQALAGRPRHSGGCWCVGSGGGEACEGATAATAAGRGWSW